MKEEEGVAGTAETVVECKAEDGAKDEGFLIEAVAEEGSVKRRELGSGRDAMNEDEVSDMLDSAADRSRHHSSQSLSPPP